MHLTRLCCVLLVETFVLIASEEDSFSLSEERQLVKNGLLHTFPVLAKEWKVSFEVNPSTYESGWRNILHLRYPSGPSHAGASCLRISIRSSRQCDHLGLCWIIPKQITYKYSSNGQDNFFDDYYAIPQHNRWTKIEVSQILDRNSYKIVFNSGAARREILSPKTFEDVKVYASDPWESEQPGKIRRLHITNLNRGEYIILCHATCQPA